MDEKITAENEERVKKWFEDSDLKAQKLDVGSSGTGKKRADWQFTKSDIVILCEVKTIFSGGEFDGKKEEEFAQFEDRIRKSLQADSTIANLPLTLTILIDTLYVPYRDIYKDFENFLKQHLEHANSMFSKSKGFCTFSYPFPERAGEAFIAIRPGFESQLEVGFMRAGSDYNYDAFQRNIEKAVSQIKSTAEEKEIADYLPIVALVSSSRQVNFHRLPWPDSKDIEEIVESVTVLMPTEPNFTVQRKIITDTCSRYKLLDWAFNQYQNDLAAILLLSSYQPDAPPIKTVEEAMYRFLDYAWIDYGYLLINPYDNSFQTKLKTYIITKHCRMIDGIECKTYQHFTDLFLRLKNDCPQLY